MAIEQDTRGAGRARKSALRAPADEQAHRLGRCAATAAAFLGGLAVLHFALQTFYRETVVMTSREMAPERRFEAHPGTFDVVAFGDSHGFAIQPDILGNAANLSHLGEGYVERYYRMEYCFEKHPGKCAAVLLPLDLHSFSPVWGEHFNSLSTSQVVDFVDYALVNGLTLELVHVYLRYRFFNYADVAAALEERLPAQEERRLRRYVRIVGTKLSDTPREFRRLNELRRKIARLGQISDKPWMYLLRIRELCVERGVRVVFIRFPVSADYYATAKEAMSVEEHDRKTSALVRDWPGAALLDYRDLYFGQDELFMDLNHLNGEGAKRFSRRLREDLMELGVLKGELDAAASNEGVKLSKRHEDRE